MQYVHWYQTKFIFISISICHCMQDLGKEEEAPPTAAVPAEPTDVKQAWNVVFFQRIFNVVIWQMKDESIKPEEPEEEEKAEGGEEYRKTIAHLSQDIFLFTCSGTLNCILYLV